MSYPGKLDWLWQQTHDHDIKTHIAHRLQPLSDELRLQLFHQASNLVIHHVGGGVKPLKDHADQPCQTLCGCVLVGCAQAHLHTRAKGVRGLINVASLNSTGQ